MDFDIVDKIKSSVKISNIISTRIKLQANGIDRFKAKCPFHNEKTPSFHVDDIRGLYKCFGCGKSGDIFNFIQEFDKISDFKSALEIISNITGIEIPKNKESMYEYSLQKRIFLINEFILNYFIKSLSESKNCLNYIKKERNIGDDFINYFKLGFAPDSYNILIDDLKKSGFSQDEILNSGIAKQANGSIYTIFRNRFMVPIFDTSNKCIAFGGRTLDKDGKPKYINSFESPIFKKGYMLYNLQNAKKLSLTQKNDFVVLSEGYMDVIALHMANIPSVAPLGTSITEHQIILLKKYFAKVIVWLDSDVAGLNAAFKTAKLILQFMDAHFNVYFVTQNNVKDPDEYLQKFGKESILKEISLSIPIHQFIWEYISKDIDFKNPSNMSLLHEKITEVISVINDKNIKFEYSSYFKNSIYKNKFTKEKNQNIQLKLEQNSISKIDELRALLIFCVNFKSSLLDCNEFDFDIENEYLSTILNKIIQDGKIENIKDLDIFNKIKLNIIHEDDRIENQFKRLCISIKIEKLQEEICNLILNSAENIALKIELVNKEKQNLLEKIKNYPI